jgi:HAD superfamily hydrolase (TIGR01509 family)
MLIIFDCDGVLRSVCWKALYEAYLVTVAYLGKDPADFFKNSGEFRKWYDSDWHKNLDRIGVPYKDKIPLINKMFHDIYDPAIQTFPWVTEILGELSSTHTIAVLSASASVSVRKSLKDSERYINIIVGCDQVKKIKPHPEGINYIIDKLGAKVSQTLMVGDMDADILAGKNAGVLTGAVSWGLTGSEKEMLEHNPDFIFSRPEDLLFIKTIWKELKNGNNRL